MRPVQIFGRIWFKLTPSQPDLSAAPALQSKSKAPWIAVATRRPMMLSPHRFRFLNEEHEVRSGKDWNDSSRKLLWRYNLHYFEDLCARDADRRREWHRDLIQRWIAENPPGKGPGWDPYPTSLRICNWIKWALQGNELSPEALHSLAVQTRYLCKHHDYFLLGNHLLVNAKALVFAGLFFDGPKAQKWYQKGLGILSRQIPEQILPDGGHFERSPMYHNLVTEDFLDLLNLMRAYGRESDFLWQDELTRMRRWAFAMCHPDGQMALFNDAAFGIAPTAGELEEYALKLGLPAAEDQGEARLAPTAHDQRAGVGLAPTRFLEQSGYIRAVRGDAVLFADVGPLGPDYLPGHGHADTLSFELSLRGRRVIVDSGTSIYEDCEERLRQRGTGAHNTLQVDGRDSSEIWASFRVARRARIAGVKFAGPSAMEAAHDGYKRLPGCDLHRRTWRLTEGELAIEDEIEGDTMHDVQLALHFHPDFRSVKVENHLVKAGIEGDLPLNVTLSMDNRLSFCLLKSTYHPEFGLSLPNYKVIGSCRGKLPLRFVTRLTWER